MRIMFVGDINLGEYYTSFGHGPRTYLTRSNIFDGVQKILDQADIVAGNLEAPLTDNGYERKTVKSSVLRGDPKYANQLSRAGFKILQVANNHSVQHGKAGFEDTISTLRNLDINPIGIKDQELTTIYFENQTLGFIAASDVPDNTNVFQKSYQSLDDTFLHRVSEIVNKVDHLFVMLHWGLEASTDTLDYQKEIISRLANIGVRGIIGQHPHLFYPLWFETSTTLAAPSLGNFVFDLFWDQRLMQSGILDVELHRSGFGHCKVWPVRLCKESGRPISSGEPLALRDSIKLYELGADMKGEQLRKLAYFFSNILKGDTRLKLSFITKKILGHKL